ncbi:hypothetical protein IMSHALPRED_009348 [Imshaugia aleurites]|uniref:Uncharacterized protein n=1 Tax=Imshaugia aleurites TaxID=172621 RepID=A0A8H3IUY4_9LECA|nr:hypothetical protein IMSHALPRED_009348 [Imshaugia aleurites]
MLCILLFLALAYAAPLDLPLDLDSFENLTATDRCSSSQDWQAYAFLVEDCFVAVQRIYFEGILHKNPDEVYEFLAPGTHPRTRNSFVRTPAQYTVESCTLSIIMLDWFGHRAPLPGRGPGGYESSDTATYRQVYDAAREVEADCLLPTRRPGWEVVGSKSSIGVFLWATNSVINDQVIGEGGTISNQSLPSPTSSNATNIADNNTDSTE